MDDTDLETVRPTIAGNRDKARSAISRILCERWNWRQANGLL